jgi:hypothetical protein
MSRPVAYAMLSVTLGTGMVGKYPQSRLAVYTVRRRLRAFDEELAHLHEEPFGENQSLRAEGGHDPIAVDEALGE